MGKNMDQLYFPRLIARRWHYLVGFLFLLIGMLTLWRGKLQIEGLDTWFDGPSARIVAVAIIALGIWILVSGPVEWFGQ